MFFLLDGLPFYVNFGIGVAIAIGMFWTANFLYAMTEGGDHEYTMVPYFAQKYPEQIMPLLRSAMEDDILTVAEYREIAGVYYDMEAAVEEEEERLERLEARQEINNLL